MVQSTLAIGQNGKLYCFPRNGKKRWLFSQEQKSLYFLNYGGGLVNFSVHYTIVTIWSSGLTCLLRKRLRIRLPYIISVLEHVCLCLVLEFSVSYVYLQKKVYTNINTTHVLSPTGYQRNLRYSSETPTFYQNYLAVRNTQT
jgi:hypothetical protein